MFISGLLSALTNNKSLILLPLNQTCPMSDSRGFRMFGMVVYHTDVLGFGNSLPWWFKATCEIQKTEVVLSARRRDQLQ